MATKQNSESALYSTTLIRTLFAQLVGLVGFFILFASGQSEAVLLKWLDLMIVLGALSIIKHMVGKATYNLSRK